MRLLILLGSIPLAVGAYFLGRVLPDEGVILIVGIQFGMLGAIPATLFLLWRATCPRIITRTEYVDRVEGEVMPPMRQIEG